MGAALLLLVTGLVAVQPPAPAAALDAAAFDPGYIISDANFYSSSAMSEQEIQNFLDARIGTCLNGQCLNVLKSDIASRNRLVSDSTGMVRCEAFTGGTGLSAATIIYRAQVACGISAKVILVTLQKEQALVTKNSPSKAALDRAMGFACPDTAPCAVDSLGFANQIYKGTLQLKTYKASRFGKQPGSHYIQWHPNAGCGGTTLDIANHATAALYNYTPYQPNRAALNNLGGSGDGCSSYGNRNFWVFYNNWFGSTTGPLSPIGGINDVIASGGGISVRGWTFDYSTQESIIADVWVNGSWVRSLRADLSRPDVAAAYAGSGENSGFASSIALTAGVKNVCIHGINVGPGQHTLLGCRTVTVVGGADPIGDINGLTASTTGANLRGWAFDSDSTSPIKVGLSVDGEFMASHAADQPRPDVKDAFPLQGSNHGYQIAMALEPGQHEVCVTALNVAAGDDTVLGCEYVTVLAPPPPPPPAPTTGTSLPRGDLNSATASATGVTLRGWAFDADTTAPIYADVWVDGRYAATARADQPRPDVKAAFPAQGDNHGFTVTVPLTAGGHRVCVYGINVGPGTHPVIECRNITIASFNPRGDINSVTAGTGTVNLRGWAFDADTPQPIKVDVWIDGRYSATMSADQARPDVKAAFPAQGTNHGFAASVGATPGSRSVCIYGINVGGGAHTLIGCRQVVVPG